MREEHEMCGGKLCYSYREAHHVLNMAKSHRSWNKKIPKRAYPCDVCRMYHLTSDSVKRYKPKGERGN